MHSKLTAAQAQVEALQKHAILSAQSLSESPTRQQAMEQETARYLEMVETKEEALEKLMDKELRSKQAEVLSVSVSGSLLLRLMLFDCATLTFDSILCSSHSFCICTVSALPSIRLS